MEGGVRNKTILKKPQSMEGIGGTTERRKPTHDFAFDELRGFRVFYYYYYLLSI